MLRIHNLLWILVVLLACNDGLETISVTDEAGQITEKYTRKKKDFAKQGKYYSYYENGKVFEEAEYKDNVLDGRRLMFYENGKTQIIEHYQAGQFEGPYQSFHENGQLQLTGQYINNAMNGEWKAFYKSGQLKEIVQFENNEENGPFVEYHENGKIKAEGNYLEGDNEHGQLKLYDDKGELEKQMECDKGKCKTIWTRDPVKNG